MNTHVYIVIDYFSTTNNRLFYRVIICIVRLLEFLRAFLTFQLRRIVSKLLVNSEDDDHTFESLNKLKFFLL